MGDEWRHKAYYKPRVLISTERILDPQFSDGLICITGAEVEMLRNLTQYLHRRSTFAQAESETGYLTPDTADWDTIQGIVSELEEKLMGCEELMQVFEDMLAQLQCICSGATTPATDTGTVQPIIDIGLEDGVLIENDPYGADTEIEARRCAVAQLTYWQAWEWLTEFIQPLQDNLMDAMVPIALGVISVMVGVTPLAIPAGAIIALLSVLIDVWVDGSLYDVQNSLWAHRDELTCAVFNGLSYDYATAEARAYDVIIGMDELSAIDRVVMRAMFAPWAMKLASLAHTQGTDWALANVVAGSCDDCTWVWHQLYTFPPSPGDWDGGFPSYSGRWPGLNAAEEGTSVEFELPSIVDNVDFEITCKYMSKFSSGWTVGYTQVEYQDVALDWHLVGQNQLTTLEPAGAINTAYGNSTDVTIPRNVLRVNMHGQPGQGDSNPWPMMVVSIDVKIYPHV